MNSSTFEVLDQLNLEGVFCEALGEAGAALLMCNVRFEMYSMLIVLHAESFRWFCLVFQATRFFSGKRADQFAIRELFLAYNPKQMLKQDRSGVVAR